MHHDAITTLERQASHRATSANQAWAWAKAIEHLARDARHAGQVRHGSPLAWLECQMTWICEDLEDAGAWPCDLNLVSDPGPWIAEDLAAHWLARLVDVTAVEPWANTAVGEAQARAQVCLVALTTSIASRKEPCVRAA